MGRGYASTGLATTYGGSVLPVLGEGNGLMRRICSEYYASLRAESSFLALASRQFSTKQGKNVPRRASCHVDGWIARVISRPPRRAAGLKHDSFMVDGSYFSLVDPWVRPCYIQHFINLIITICRIPCPHTESGVRGLCWATVCFVLLRASHLKQLKDYFSGPLFLHR